MSSSPEYLFSLWHDGCLDCEGILNKHRKAKEEGIGSCYLLGKYVFVFSIATTNLAHAFIDIFKENQIMLTAKKWIEKVQKVLAKCPSAKVLEKETPAFKFLRQNATEINKILSDIQKLKKNNFVGLNDDDSSDEDLDEAFDQEKAEFDEEKAEKEMLSLIEEIKRLVKVMGDLAVDLEADYWATAIQALLYDVKKGGPQKFGDEIMVEVVLDNLSEEQLMLTPLMSLSHLPPEKQEKENERESKRMKTN